MGHEAIGLIDYYYGRLLPNMVYVTVRRIGRGIYDYCDRAWREVHLY